MGAGTSKYTGNGFTGIVAALAIGAALLIGTDKGNKAPVKEDLKARIERVYNDPNYSSKKEALVDLHMFYESTMKNSLLTDRERKALNSFDANDYQGVMKPYVDMHLMDANTNNLNDQDKIYLIRLKNKLSFPRVGF